MIRLLVQAGADPNQPCHVDWGAGLETPLCGAVRKKKTAAAELLLTEHGADPNAGNRSGRSVTEAPPKSRSVLRELGAA